MRFQKVIKKNRFFVFNEEFTIIADNYLNPWEEEIKKQQKEREPLVLLEYQETRRKLRRS
jgi:hypothetical protein